MPLDDQINTARPDTVTIGDPSKGKLKSKLTSKNGKSGQKDEILINPDIKQVMQEAAEKHHVLAFGRMNPITSGHEAVVKKIHDVADEHKAGHTLVVSHSQDAKKNPLTAEQKVKHAKAAFSGTNVKAASKDAPTILHHAAQLHKQGVSHLHVVAGSDRKEEMHTLLHKYNNVEGKHGHYNFKSISVYSSGERDPDAEGTTGISASKMREHAAAGNKEKFHAGAPKSMSTKQKDAMYKDTRKGLGLHESVAIESFLEYNRRPLELNDFNRLYESVFNQARAKDPIKSGEHDVNVLALKAHVKKVEGKKPKTVWNPNTRKYKVVYEQKADLNESFGTFMTAHDLGIVAEGGFAMHPSVQGQLDEDAAHHLQQAAIMQRTGKPLKAAQHRKIASALQRGDMTAAKALKSELSTLKE